MGKYRADAPTVGIVVPHSRYAIWAAGLQASGLNTLHVEPQASNEANHDPHWLNHLAHGVVGADALLLICAANASPEWSVHAPVVSGLPIGIMWDDGSDSPTLWLNAIAQRGDDPSMWAVLAMWKEPYLHTASRMARQFSRVKAVKVRRLLALQITREDLCRRLAALAPRLVIYLGHARPRGFCGYSGLRFEHLAHIDPTRPCGTVMAMTCHTLRNMEQTDRSFGRLWVESGKACAYLGAVGDVDSKANSELVRLIGDLLVNLTVHTIGDLLVEVSRVLDRNDAQVEMRRAFECYRLIGNPCQPLRV